MNPDTKLIPLTQGLHAIVDAADYTWLSQWTWRALNQPHGFRAVRDSPRAGGKRGLIWMHRVIMDVPDGVSIDHINHNPLDNRRSNLRICTIAENNRNSRSHKGSSSQYRGVHWDIPRGKWRVQIGSDKKVKHLGDYSCEIEAAKAYDAAARTYHGEFANPNFGANQ